MNIILLHDPLSAASRAFLAGLGVPIPEGDDVTVAIGGDTVRIVSGHDACVGVCPAFPGYPAALVIVDGQQYVLAHPATWGEVTAWAADPVPAGGKPTTMTINAFLRRFTMEELTAIEVAQDTDPTIRVGEKMLMGVEKQIVDLADLEMVKYVHYLGSKDLLTLDRVAEILTP